MRLSQRVNFGQIFCAGAQEQPKSSCKWNREKCNGGQQNWQVQCEQVHVHRKKKNNVVSATTTKKEVNYLTLLFDIFTHEPNYIQVTRQFAMNSDHSEHHIKQCGVHNCIFCTRTETDISCGRSLSAVYKTQGEKLKE